MATTSAGQIWARSQRYHDNREVQYEDRYALTRINPADGALGPEHQYARNYDAPLSSPGLLPTTISGFLGDDSVQVEQRAVDSRGLMLPRLQRWPAAGSLRGDVQLRPLRAPGLIVGATSSVAIELGVENSSSATVEGIRSGFASTQDNLKALLRSCTINRGTGTCPGWAAL